MGRAAQFRSDELTPFARWVYDRMSESGVSVRDLAVAVGVNRSFFVRLFNSHREKYRQYRFASYETTLALGAALGDVPGAMEAGGHLEHYLKSRRGIAPPAPEQAQDAQAVLIASLRRRVAEQDQEIRRLEDELGRLRRASHEKTAESERRWRAEAAARPIEGPYAAFALEVRRLMGHESGGARPFVRARAVAGRMGVSHSTVHDMTRGRRPSPAMIRLFAQATEGDEAELLSLAGFAADDAPRRRRPAPPRRSVSRTPRSARG